MAEKRKKGKPPKGKRGKKKYERPRLVKHGVLSIVEGD